MAGFIVPALRMIILLSAVNILAGLIFESTGNDPAKKSKELIATA